MDTQVNFVLSECESLREHMEGTVDELRSLERFSVIATAGFWGWIGINGKNDIFVDFEYFVVLPLILVIFMFIKSIALKDRYRNAANYIKRVENELLKDTELGWQRSNERKMSRLPKWSDRFYTAIIFINLVMAIWFMLKFEIIC